MSRLFPEYRWKDVAFGDVRKRNTIIPVDELGKRVPADARECYATINRFPDAYVEHFNEKKTISGYEGPCYADLFWLDIDDENLEESQSSALKAFFTLTGFCGVPMEDVKIFFSGKKGFHLGVPTSTFGVEPSPDMPRAFAALARRVADQAGVPLDPAIYKVNSLLRLPNTINQKSGLFKIQLTLDELGEDIESVKALAKTARREKLPAGSGEWNNTLAQLYEQCLEEVRRDDQRRKELPVINNGDLAEMPKFEKLCIWRMLKGVSKGGRNEVCLRLAVFFRQKGLPLSMTTAALEEWNRHNEVPLDEVDVQDVARRAYENPYDYGCHDPILDRYCVKQCYLWPEKSGGSEDLTADIFTTAELRDVYLNYIKDRDLAKVSWGIDWLDLKTRKVAPGQVGIILARTGVGKTALTIQIIRENSKNGVPSIFFSLEQLGAEIFERMAQNACEMRGEDIEAGFGTGDLDFITSVGSAVVQNYEHAYICTKDRLTVDQVIKYVKAAEEKAGQKMRLIVVDYLGRMKGPGRDPYEKMSEIALGMKEVAKACEAAVIVVAQVNRTGGKGAVEVTLDMARDSGQIEEAADYIVTMWRANGDEPGAGHGVTVAGPNGYGPIPDAPDYFPVILCIQKNRKGPRGVQVPMMFRPSVMRFEPIDWRPKAQGPQIEF